MDVRTWRGARFLLPLFLAALIALQVQQASARIGTLRDRQRQQFLNAVDRLHAETTAALTLDLRRGEGPTRLLARLAAFQPSDPADGRGGWAAAEAFVAAACDREEGRLAARLEPQAARASTSEAADGASAWISAALRIRHRAPVSVADARAARVLEVELDGTPLLERIRSFRPVEGVANTLIDGSGRALAVDRAALDLGLREGELLADWYAPAVLRAVLAVQPRVQTPSARLLVGEVSGAGERLLLVSLIPDSALAKKAEPARKETLAIIGVSVLTSALIALAGFFLHRARGRERELRTRQRQLERERAVFARLSTADRLSALGLLTAGVAHEVNNPLEGIGNYLSLLEQDDLAPEARRRYLERVRHGLERIRVLVRDLLGFARPGTERAPVDLVAVVRRAVDLAHLSDAVKGCSMEAEGLEAPLVIEGNAGGLEQVLLNLLLNAGRAMGGEGRIRIVLAREGAEAVLRVEDDGPGVPEDALPRVFDPFFTQSGGTGLGLSICYGIVQGHGGTIEVANRAAGGTSFSVRLPLTERDVQSEAGRDGESRSSLAP